MKNYFSVFALEQNTEINLDDLEQKYLAFQQAFHPDKSTTSDIERSMAVNEAYEVLKNPLSRASHILQLNGIDLENDSVAPKVDTATLMEVLEIRENIAQSSSEEIDNVKKELNKKVKSLINEAALKLENKDFNAAAQILIKAKYFDKTLKDLKKKQ